MSDRVVFWDFDGTPAQRPGLWSACILEVLDDVEPAHGVTLDEIRAGLIDGFPWHRADVPHPELSDADAWWGFVALLIARVLVDVGVPQMRAHELVPFVRRRYVNPSVGWERFDDAGPALAATAEAGWRNVVLSNHVPELPALVDGVGLGDCIDKVLTSAVTGYEKPHPRAFRIALAACGYPATAFMVGDNPVADVRGAEAVELPAVLVRNPGEARYRADGLAGAVEIILGLW